MLLLLCRGWEGMRDENMIQWYYMECYGSAERWAPRGTSGKVWVPPFPPPYPRGRGRKRKSDIIKTSTIAHTADSSTNEKLLEQTQEQVMQFGIYAPGGGRWDEGENGGGVEEAQRYACISAEAAMQKWWDDSIHAVYETYRTSLAQQCHLINSYNLLLPSHRTSGLQPESGLHVSNHDIAPVIFLWRTITFVKSRRISNLRFYDHNRQHGKCCSE